MSSEDPMTAWLAAQQADAADVQAYRDMERLLAGASPVDRAYCPSREDLISPAANLGATLTLARTRHVSACPLCRSDLADYEALVEIAPVGAMAALEAGLVLLWDRAKGVVEQVQSGLAPVAAPALALRGDEAPRALSHVAAFQAGTLRLTWAVGASGIDVLCEALEPAPLSYRVDLSEAAGLLESRSADEAGHVRLLGLAPGAYRVRVFVPEASAAAIDLSLELQGEAPPTA